MSLWRLEWLRLVRTKRLLAVVAVYGFFGLTSPPLVRYMDSILERVGAGVQVIAPTPTALEGLTTFVSNTNQIGLLVYVLIVSSAVAFDSQREMAVFLRTRVGGYRELLLPKYALSLAAGAVAFCVGAIAVGYGTVVLLGEVDPLGMALGSLLSVLYLAFIAAVAAALGARLNSVLSTAGLTLVVALGLGILGTIGSLGEWLPSHLLGGFTSLPLGGDLSSYLRASAITLLATIALLALASRLGDAREV
jgi:ABC-2 type transport system permease protein